jgi:hypothetical protein
MSATQRTAKFKLGRIVSTPNALNQLTYDEILAGLQRHITGDWGDMDEHDRAANDNALIDGTRLLSVYHTDAGVKFWIITEADRSSTCILLPEDY